MTSASDKNLIFGIIALQMDFVRREQLIAATSAWLMDKSRKIEEILIEQGALREDDRQLLARLVARHLEHHGGDPQRSLAALSSLGSVADQLRSLGDEGVAATLSMVASDHPSDFHDETVVHESTASTTAGAATPNATDARFRILRSHAKGGLGEVYVAKDMELNREVALKEIQAKYADDETSRLRFLMEAEVTGGLEHPGIVPVYGLGRFDDGRPFYAMRFIQGDSLQETANRFHARVGPDGESNSEDETSESLTRDFNGLAFRKLLGRFVDVCEAIEYAHSRGVLHRDLKPGNIMLGKYGETLVVDWGLAKAQGTDEINFATGETLLRPASASGSAATVMGSALGTPAFMPPEQAAGDLNRLGPASDVYSLGATLFYVLTGRPPFRGKDLAIVLNQVQQGDFPPPGNLQRDIPKALEAVCLRAMATRTTDRYSSPRDLADDVERYLGDEPVAAHAEPFSLRARRWLRKRPKSVAAVAAAVLVGLISTTVIAAVVSNNAKIVAGKNRDLTTANAKLDESNRSLDGANAQLAKKNEQLETANQAERLAKQDALAVLEFFLDNVLARARPKGQSGGLGIDATIREAIDAAESEVAESFTDRPLVEASIRNTIGVTYWLLGKPLLAIVQHERALNLRRTGLGLADVDTLTSMNNLAVDYQADGRWDRAIELFEETLKLKKANLAPEHPDTLVSMNNLAKAYSEMGRLDEAFPLFEETLKLRKAKLGPKHPDTLAVMNNLAIAYLNGGRLDEAIPILEKTLKLTKAALGSDHPDTLGSLGNLAYAYQASGRTDEALPMLEESLRLTEAILGADHSDMILANNNLAMAYEAAARMDEALLLYERTLKLAKAHRGASHPDTLRSMVNLGHFYRVSDRLNEAMPLQEEALRLAKAKLGADHPITLAATTELVATYLSAKQLENAAPLIEQFVASHRSRMNENSQQFADLLAQVANLLVEHQQYSAAEPYFRECLRIIEKKVPDSWVTPNVQSLLGSVLARQEKFVEAESLLLEGYRRLKEGETKIPIEYKSRLIEALQRLVELYDAWEKPEAAAKWRAVLQQREPRN